MKNLWNNIWSGLLMSAEPGAAGASAGTGTPSFLAPPTGGGKVPPTAGNADSVPPADSNKPAVAPSAGNPPAGAAPTDWRSSLPPELQEDASIKKFSDVSTLARSYINAQKLIGADKIAVPTKHTTDEEMRAIFHKLGVPEKLEEYQVKFKDGVSIDDKFGNQFKEMAHKAGVLPKQAQALADWFSDINMGAEQALQADIDKRFQENMATLKKDWGNSFDLNISRATKVASELGEEGLIDHLNSLGVGADPKVIKFLAKVGETLFAEHKFVEGEGTSNVMNPEELDREIRKLQMDPIYGDKAHPNHKALVKDVEELYKKRYPQVK